MNVLDLFSGIGGLSLGLERAGMRTIAFCEIEPYCRSVLRRHWPNVPCYPDVRELTADRLATDGVERIDLIAGGYPCQPFSHAGDRKGKTDDRHVWPHMRRLVAQLRPTWVIAENVAGHVTLGLDEVLTELESDGYAARPIVIPAVAVDAKHIRARVWIIGRNASDTDSGELWHESRRRRGAGRESARQSGDAGAPRVTAHADSSRRGEQRRPEPSAAKHPAIEQPRWWAAQPGICGVADGVSYRVDRLRALGNAVVPQIPEIIGRAIVAWEQSR